MKICDRCKKEDASTYKFDREVHYTDSYSASYLDLCPACAAEIYQVIENFRKGEK